KVLLATLALLTCGACLSQDQLQMETAGMIQFAAGRAAELAEAIPGDKYSWSPEDGVRSVAGVIAHMISANYFFAMKLGAIPPEGINLQTLEKDLTTKEQLVPALKASIGHITGAIKNVDSSTLGDKVEFPFPGEFTTMSAILIIQGHNNEHLGQLIAYGRSNGVTPPWSN
ncbi:MAG: DinB family protein, partial [Bacteroidota bacterium]